MNRTVRRVVLLSTHVTASYQIESPAGRGSLVTSVRSMLQRLMERTVRALKALWASSVQLMGPMPVSHAITTASAVQPQRTAAVTCASNGGSMCTTPKYVCQPVQLGQQ
jgi:hypothetical protein